MWYYLYMSAPITLSTEREGLTLRQLTIEDAPAYFEAIDANREHLSQFGDETADKYPDLEAVEQSILEPKNPDKVRLGIWDDETFVGSINLTPDEDGKAAEVGYWLDGRHTGHGYATLATTALSKYAAPKFQRLYAEVVDGNEASARVLERSGYQQTAREAGRLVFELANMTGMGRKISLEETDKFEREGFSGSVYVDGSKGEGFNALQLDVHGRHPKKRILEGNTRSYFVADGAGTFILNGEAHQVQQGDLFVIPAGSEYEYEGKMRLFEFNVSPDGSFGDEKLE